jgi:hypothetical protein
LDRLGAIDFIDRSRAESRISSRNNFSKLEKKAKLYIFALLLLVLFTYFYSVFLLLSQPTKPTPMLLNRTAPGAGIGL